MISRVLILFLCPCIGFAALPAKKELGKLTERLSQVRYKVVQSEKELIKTLSAANQVKSNIKKILALITLQKQEQQLSQERIKELELAIGEMAERKGELNEKILLEKRAIRKNIQNIFRINELSNTKLSHFDSERLQSPIRYLTSSFFKYHSNELEALKVDFQDVELLEQKIHEEQSQLGYLFNELKEKEAVLVLNQQLQSDLLKQKFEQRLGQWEHYQQLKRAQSSVEDLMTQFQARKELEKTLAQEKWLKSQSQVLGEFVKLKGKFDSPVNGTIVGTYGKAYDPKSNLMIFKKGIEIATQARAVVKSIFNGRVAYAGELPDYGRVTIIDHGDHYYSLIAKMGEINRKAGDLIKTGDELGQADDAGTPVYFEIRSRNVAVNPLQWINN